MTIRAVSRRFAIPHATRSNAVQLAPSSTRSPRLRPRGATMNPEPPRKRGHTLASGPGCSRSVYFLVSEACSRSFLWLRRRVDQRIIGPVLGLRIIADALTPRGNRPLNPWSPVPVVLDCVHHDERPGHAFRPGRPGRPGGPGRSALSVVAPVQRGCTAVDEWFPAEPAGSCLRLNYSGPRPDAFTDAVRIIGEVLASF